MHVRCPQYAKLTTDRRPIPANSVFNFQVILALILVGKIDPYRVLSYGINSKEAPRIGFYPLGNATVTADASAVAAFLSAASATVATTLPNSLLPTPVFSTPGYGFNSSIKASTGGIVSSALATSTYSPIFGNKLAPVTSLPAITPSPTVTILTLTNAQGVVATSTSTLVAAITLGVPPGYNSATGLHLPSILLMMTWLLLWSYISLDF